MRMVRVIKLFLAPTGLSVCALRPLVDAALYLITLGAPSAPRAQTHVRPILTTIRTRAIAGIGIVEKYSWNKMPSEFLSSNQVILMAFWMTRCLYGS